MHGWTFLRAELLLVRAVRAAFGRAERSLFGCFAELLLLACCGLSFFVFCVHFGGPLSAVSCFVGNGFLCFALLLSVGLI